MLDPAVEPFGAYRPGRPDPAQAVLIAARRERVRTRYLAGASVKKVASAEGISFETARDDLHKLGVRMRPRGKQRKYGPDEQRPCARCGAPTIAPASELARGRKRFYCDSCPRALRRREQDDLIVSLYVDEARTQHYIAERLGVSDSIVHRALRRLGLPTDAHRRGPRELQCEQCCKTLSTYDDHARFCSRECWGAWRWKHGEAIGLVGRWGGRSRQVWLGRWEGRKYGALGGRPVASVSEAQRAEIEELAAKGWGRRAIANRLLLSERAVRNVLSS